MDVHRVIEHAQATGRPAHFWVMDAAELRQAVMFCMDAAEQDGAYCVIDYTVPALHVVQAFRLYQVLWTVHVHLCGGRN